MVRERYLEVIEVTSHLFCCELVWVFVFHLLVVRTFLELLGMRIWQSTKTEDAGRVGALVDVGDSNVLCPRSESASYSTMHSFLKTGLTNDTWKRGLHDVFQGIGNALKHVWVDETPNDAQQRVKPFDRLRDEICRRLPTITRENPVQEKSAGLPFVAYRLSPLLLALPLQLTPATNDLLHPEEHSRAHTGRRWDQANEGGTEHPSE